VAQTELNWGFMKKSPKESPELDEARLRQQAIGARLRQLFDDVVNEPIPEDFLDILRAADDADARGASRDGGHGAEGEGA
jgi:hypothetical protein